MSNKALLAGGQRGTTRQQVTVRWKGPDMRTKDPATGKRRPYFEPKAPTDEQVASMWKEMEDHDIADPTRDYHHFSEIYKGVMIARKLKDKEARQAQVDPLGNRSSLMCQCPGYDNPDDRMQCRCSALICYCRQLEDHPVNPGSIGTYLGNARATAKQLSEKWTGQEIAVLNRMQGYFKAMYGLCKADEPGAASTAEIEECLAALEEVDPLVVVCLYLQCLCGTRYDDLGAIKYRDIIFTRNGTGGDRFRCTVKAGKTASEGPAHWRQVDELLSGCLVTPPKAFWDFINAREQATEDELDYEYFRDTNTDRAIAALAKKELRPRTKNFRKHFAARIWAETDGNMSEVARRMGHGSVSSARFYIDCGSEPVVEEYRAKMKDQQEAQKVVSYSETEVHFYDDEDPVLPQTPTATVSKKKVAPAGKKAPATPAPKVAKRTEKRY